MYKHNGIMCILLVVRVTEASSDSRREELDFISWWGVAGSHFREHVGQDILLWPSRENTVSRKWLACMTQFWRSNTDYSLLWISGNKFQFLLSQTNAYSRLDQRIFGLRKTKEKKHIKYYKTFSQMHLWLR